MAFSSTSLFAQGNLLVENGIESELSLRIQTPIQKGLFPCLLMMGKACHLQRYVHTYKACETMCNKLVIGCGLSLCYMVKGIVKKSIQRDSSTPFSPSARTLHDTFQFVWGDPTSKFPLPVTSNIITWAQNMFKGQSENRHCNKKWSF